MQKFRHFHWIAESARIVTIISDDICVPVDARIDYSDSHIHSVLSSGFRFAGIRHQSNLFPQESLFPVRFTS